jgi:transglutaminase-like putative cysteine protease
MGITFMTVFSVHHTTTYRYKNPVRPGLHQLMFRPRDSFDQRLIDSRLTVAPVPAETRWIHDVFGNCVTLVDFSTKTTSLKFESVIRLEHTPENAPDFRIEEYARSHPFSYAEGEFPDLAAYMHRHYPQDAAVDEWLAKFMTIGVRRRTGQLLMTLNEAVAQSFSYKRRTTPGTQTPGETIDSQQGTCRDFALLMMEAARSLGSPHVLLLATSTFPFAMVQFGWAAARRTHGAKSTCPARDLPVPKHPETCGSKAGTSAFAAYVGNWTHVRGLIRRSTEPDLNRHPEKIDRH